jgi:hypothetical protein
MLHEGAKVRSGFKYVLRCDLMFMGAQLYPHYNPLYNVIYVIWNQLSCHRLPFGFFLFIGIPASTTSSSLSLSSGSPPSSRLLLRLFPARARCSFSSFAATLPASLTRSVSSATSSSSVGQSSIFFPTTFSIRWTSSTSYCVTRVIDFPARPARAVRPTRCM